MVIESTMAKVQLLQLPVPPPAYYAATGNVPLAAASLASSLAQNQNKFSDLSANAVAPEITDRMGDAELVQYLLSQDPNFIGLSLYLWNTERSLHIAQEIKRQNPKIGILIGGPEVNEDNPFVLNQLGYDIAVAGEAEHTFVALMDALLNGKDVSAIENISIRDKFGKMSPFSKERSADFPLTDFPSPYVSGFLSVDPKRSTYLETVRGCKSQCTYCFYPKSSQTLRTLNIDETIKLIQQLKENGAKELVFLDPTFNHRPGFEAFLDAIIDVNFDGQMTMFAELRSEGVTPKLAKKLAKAGFNRIELGMQSINPETLKRVKRYGDPQKVAEVAKMLVGEGIDLLLDLIIGLPGDTPDDVEKGIHFFLKHNLGEWVQAFPLSLLPGTAMRKDAEKEGLIYMPTPPYRIIRTPNFTAEQLRETLYLAEDLLDRRVDEFPRPFLCEKDDSVNDVYTVDLIRDSKTEITARIGNPGSRHHSVWFSSNSFEKDIIFIRECMERRIRIDPFCTIDFIFYIHAPIQENLISQIKMEIDRAHKSYLSLVLAHRDENMQHRIVFVLSETATRNWEWISFMKERTDLYFYLETSAKNLGNDLDEIGISAPMVYLNSSECHETLWNQLKMHVDSEAIVFRSRKLEKKWSNEVLGYGEV